MRRGNETQRHLMAKATIGKLFNRTDWSVFYEQRNADVIVMHHTTRFVAAIELESSPRNVLRNIERNVAYGCQAVAVVSLTDQYLRQITNKTFKYQQAHPDLLLNVFPYTRRGRTDLYHWIESLTGDKS